MIDYDETKNRVKIGVELFGGGYGVVSTHGDDYGSGYGEEY